jgi:DNA modification methylase
MIKDQFITDDFALYNSDCMYVLPTIPDKSIDLSFYSPPFRGLYNYSSSENDFSNCETPEQFLKQYEFLVEQIARVTKPGRITAVHVTDIMNTKTEVLEDFPHEIISIHKRHGFDYKNRITVWKEPLKVRMRTMVRSLMHKMIVEDSTSCFTASPDYILVFKKKGENEVPVIHPFGLTHYAGEYPLLIAHLENYGTGDTIKAIYNTNTHSSDMSAGVEAYINFSFAALKEKYKNWEDPKTNKLSHIIWQRYASSVWDDFIINNVLPFRDCKEEDDEKHVHPLQLDVNDRLVELYSNPGEFVLTPFMGVGSEAYSAVSMGRKAIGIELKESYYRQSVENMKLVNERFQQPEQINLL